MLTAGGGQNGCRRNVVTDFDREMQALFGDGPPRLALVEAERLTMESHRRDVESGAQGNLCRATLHLQGLPRPRPRAFGKDDQVAARRNRLGTSKQQIVLEIIADVASGADRAPRARMRGKCGLHHATGIGNKSKQEDHIDQRGMVGQDEQPTSLQPFHADEFVVDQPQQPHPPDEQAQDDPDHRSCCVLAAIGPAQQQCLQRKHHQPERQTADAETREGQCGGDDSPQATGPSKPISHGDSTANCLADCIAASGVRRRR